jgi:hypothetical protein
VRLLAESEQNGGEKGKNVRFSAQRASPELALRVSVCVSVVASSLSFCRRTEVTATKRREKERDSNARALDAFVCFFFLRLLPVCSLARVNSQPTHPYELLDFW